MYKAQWLLLLTLLVYHAVRGSNIGKTRQNITVSDDGGFTDILIAIHKNISQDTSLLDTIKERFRVASKYLTNATDGNLYIRNVTILLPESWDVTADYFQADAETVDSARVIVGPENPAWGDTPYTLQPGLCGKESDYIHLTPNYLRSSTPGLVEKRLIREFAHLRWGVFDEDVPETDTISPRFYMVNNTLQSTLCTHGISGVFYDISRQTTGCEFDMNTRLWTSDCRYILSSDGTMVPASLMSAESLDSVTQFCDSDTSGDSRHNNLAPNRQNRICGDSVWGVLSSHPDFAENYANGRLVTPEPVFQILHPRVTDGGAGGGGSGGGGSGGIVVNTSRTTVHCDSELVCLTLDVSGSMSSYDRIDKMRLAVQNYVQHYLPLGTMVSITTFTSSATTLAGMTNITGDAVRQDLVNVLASITAGGGTDIGSGMSACLQILLSYGGMGNVDGSRILVLSDGQGSIGSLDQLVDEGVIVDTIAYSQAADPGLSSISDATGGLKHFTADDESARGLNGALLATIQRDCESGIVTLVNEQVTLQQGEDVITQRIYIDSTLGDDTKLVFSYTVDINVNVSTPDGNSYTITKNAALKTITVEIHGVVTGLITYEIRRADAFSTEDITITITSLPVEGADTINVKFRMDSPSSVYFSPTSLITGYVGIFQRLTPILGLTVKVIVGTPSAADVEINYFDNGRAVDSTPNDGIYTGVITANHMSGSGYYSIRVLVSGEGFLPARPGQNTRKKRSLGTSIGEIQRTTSGGYLNVNSYYYSTDALPPGRITDLQLKAARRVDNSFTLSWTAPGDDYYSGSVSGYNVNVSSSRRQSDFVSLPHEAVGSNYTDFMVPANSEAQLVIDVGQINNTLLGVDGNDEISTYFFIVRALDEAGNEGEWSNTVSASFIDPGLMYGGQILVGISADGELIYEPLIPETEPPTTSTTTETTQTATETTQTTTTETVTLSYTLTTTRPQAPPLNTPDTGAQKSEMLVKTVATSVPVIGFLILAVVVGILLFIKMKKRKVFHIDSEYDYGDEVYQPTPPRSTVFMFEAQTTDKAAIKSKKSSKKTGKKPKALPKLRKVTPKK